MQSESASHTDRQMLDVIMHNAISGEQLQRIGKGFSRRSFLQVGALSVGGLSTLGFAQPDLFHALAQVEGSRPAGIAKACIFIFLQGGPAHQDSLDPKPDSAVEFRGEFKSIATSVTGTHVCEHLPLLARLADRYALIRSCTHDDVEHNSAAYACLTGRMHPQKGQIVGPSPNDFPPYGAALARLRPAATSMLPWVTLPAYLVNAGTPFPSQNAGFLGAVYDPLAIRSDPNDPNFAIEGLSLSSEMPDSRLNARRGLLRHIDNLARNGETTTAAQVMDHYQQRAFDLISSPTARLAFHLDTEPVNVRERYGRTPFGQSLLLSRRLVEAGVQLVTVNYTSEQPRRPGCSISWDTHEDNFPDLKNKLLPDLDHGLSALLEDLDHRGLLSETLIVVTGEFGRTPKVGQRLTEAAATANGRDHWTRVYSALWAGGGIHGGLVYGASDKIAAEPAHQAVVPAQLAASLFHALGVDPEQQLHDRQGRPHALCVGDPILDLFA